MPKAGRQLILRWVLPAGIVLLSFWLLLGFFTSDEDRIRAVFEDIEQNFNESTGARRIVAHFADSYHDANTGIDSEKLLGGLRHAFLARRHPKLKKFPYDLKFSNLQMALVADRPLAEVVVELKMHDLLKDPPKVQWSCLLEAELVEEGGSWLIASTRWKRISGKPPR